MSFGGSGKGKQTRGFTISGLNETLGGIDSFKEDLHTRTIRAILTDAATFYKNDAVKNAHVITGKTRDSIKIESVSDNEAVITAGFGMPYEEKRPGNKVRQNKKSPSGDAVINSFAESILSTIASPSVFPRSRRLLRSDFLSKHDTELSKHGIKPIEVCRIRQHLIQFC